MERRREPLGGYRAGFPTLGTSQNGLVACKEAFQALLAEDMVAWQLFWLLESIQTHTAGDLFIQLLDRASSHFMETLAGYWLKL